MINSSHLKLSASSCTRHEFAGSVTYSVRENPICASVSPKPTLAWFPFSSSLLSEVAARDRRGLIAVVAAVPYRKGDGLGWVFCLKGLCLCCNSSHGSFVKQERCCLIPGAGTLLPSRTWRFNALLHLSCHTHSILHSSGRKPCPAAVDSTLLPLPCLRKWNLHEKT